MQAAGYAAADSVQALPLVSTIWGVVLFSEYFRRAPLLVETTPLSGAAFLCATSARGVAVIVYFAAMSRVLLTWHAGLVVPHMSEGWGAGRVGEGCM